MAAIKKAGTEKTGGFVENLTEDEKYKLAGLGLFLLVMATVLGVWFFQQSMNQIEAATNRYEDALDFIATAGPAYAERSAAEETGTHKKIDDEVLRNNNIKLTSFVAEQAEKAEIEVSSYDEDQLPFGNTKGDGPITVEKQLRVEIRDAKMSQLMNLLDQIHQSPEPVFVKRLDIRKKRKTEGEVRAIVTVSTYVKKEQEG